MVESIEELRKICQHSKGDPYDAQVHKWTRKVSIYFTKMLLYTSITANQATILSFLMFVISGVLYTSKEYWRWIMAAFFYELYHILDHCDGEIARYRKQSSARGAFLDDLGHHLSNPLVYACMSWGLFLQFNNLWFLIIGQILSISTLLHWVVPNSWYRYIYAADEKSPDDAYMKHVSPKYIKKIKISIRTRSILFRLVNFLTPRSVNYLFIVVAIFDGLNFFYSFNGFSLNSRAILFLIYAITRPIITIIKITYIGYTGRILGIKSFIQSSEDYSS